MLKTSWQVPETPQGVGGPGVHLLHLKGGLRSTGRREFGAGAQDLGYPAVPEVPGLLLTSGKEGGEAPESTPGRVTGFSDANACSPSALPKWMPCPPD